MGKILEEQNLKKDDIKQYKKVWIFILLITAVTGFFVLTNIYYIDALNGCAITVEEDITGGSKQGVYKALDYIKQNNKEDYKKVCNNVTNIIEKYCFYMDPRVRTSEEFKLQGCYIKGSKTIYILPSKDLGDTEIKNRAKSILKYANYSNEYWRNK